MPSQAAEPKVLSPVLPPPQPGAPAPAAGEPVGGTTITIGQIDIVMAPPPRPAPPPPPKPDRGFARYAAMRSARDRGRW